MVWLKSKESLSTPHGLLVSDSTQQAAIENGLNGVIVLRATWRIYVLRPKLDEPEVLTSNHRIVKRS
jgi:hypothetical protein